MGEKIKVAIIWGILVFISALFVANLTLLSEFLATEITLSISTVFALTVYFPGIFAIIVVLVFGFSSKKNNKKNKKKRATKYSEKRQVPLKNEE